MEFTELIQEQFIIRLNKLIKINGLRTDVTEIEMEIEQFDDSNVDRVLDCISVVYNIRTNGTWEKSLSGDIISKISEIIRENYEYLRFRDDCRISAVKMVKGFIWGMD